MVIEIVESRLYVGNVTEKPVHHVNKMRELCKECAAVQVGRSVPPAGFVITFIAIPVTIELHHVNLSQTSRLNYLFDPDRRRRIAVLHHTEDLSMVFQTGVDDLLGIGYRERHRLFDDHVTACFHRPDSHRGMQTVRHADI